VINSHHRLSFRCPTLQLQLFNVSQYAIKVCSMYGLDRIYYVKCIYSVVYFQVNVIKY